MSNKKTHQYAVVLHTSTSVSVSELTKQANALIAQVFYLAKINNRAIKIYLVGSEHDPRLSAKWKEETGKKGRPKTLFWDKPKNALTVPHIHLLIKCNPAATVIKGLKQYWEEKQGIKAMNGNRTFYQSHVYNAQGYLAYIDMQSSFARTKTYDPDNLLGDWN